MNKPEIIETPNFEYTPQGIDKLKTVLKTGKIIRNPFAKFYSDKVEVTILKESEIKPRLNQHN